MSGNEHMLTCTSACDVLNDLQLSLVSSITGGSKELGAGLSNLVTWHKGQEVKMREMNQ